jgi:hypothetical protein
MLSEKLNRYFAVFGLEITVNYISRSSYFEQNKKSLSHLPRFVALLELCLQLVLHFLVFVFVLDIRLRIIIRPLRVLFRSLFCPSFFGGSCLLNLLKLCYFNFFK